MKLAKGSQYQPSVAVPTTEVNTRIVLSQGRTNEIPRRYITTGDTDGERDQRTQSKSQNTQVGLVDYLMGVFLILNNFFFNS